MRVIFLISAKVKDTLHFFLNFFLICILAESTFAKPTIQNGNYMNEKWKTCKVPSKEELKKILDPQQYEVTQNEGTEKAFTGKYWDNHQDGIYVDIVSGEPLFSSLDKFDSGTGWPSFTRPLEEENILTKVDRGLFGKRIEVRSKCANSHLGHVFDDGPQPTGKRYCMNSAALRFIPKEKLKNEGYEKYLKLFEKSSK